MYNSQNYHLESDCIPHRDNEPEFAEWFEDAPNEAEWIDAYSTTSGGVTASSHSMSFFDDLYERNKSLENELKEVERKYKNLQIENQRLNIQLANEKQRSSQLEKKLRYIKDNQSIFNHLKEEYLNIKYNESVGRSNVHVIERDCQTSFSESVSSDTIASRKHVDTAIPDVNKSMIVVKKDDLSKLQDTVLTLKKMVDQREKTWGYNAEREKMYKTNIADMKRKVKSLSEMLSQTPIEASKAKAMEHNIALVQKENSFLRKIIIKLEQRQREMEKMSNPKKRQLLSLTDVEKELVKQLINKYTLKLKQKISTSPTNNNNNNSDSVKKLRNQKIFCTVEKSSDLIEMQGDCIQNLNNSDNNLWY